ncbi:hypothetical protein GCM10009838_70150 [Catenulispora subtropica]|uniref:Lipoprotein n=1 Tax=Catenulispora subtropica TaxID=450798 RepID=A0ABP5EEQ5_9ACTN
MLAFGDGDGDYKALPTCQKIASALPGKPALTVGQNVTDVTAKDFRGRPLAVTDIECKALPIDVDVELFRAGDLNIITSGPYPDKAVHDGRSRADDFYNRQTKQWDELKPGVRYGSITYSDSTCTVMTLKRNATVRVTVPNPPTHSLEEWKAACRQIAEKEVPKVVDAALD